MESRRIEAWVVATITKVTGERLVCEFDGMPKDEVAEYARGGPRICPLGSRTAGWEWRSQLKPGDTIDVLDTQTKWFLGTVLDTKVEDGVKQVKACFRVYVPDGSKFDDDERAYEGWSSSYDAWFFAHSIKIQPYPSHKETSANSITKSGTVYCSHMLDDESPAPDDSSDLLQYHPSGNDRPCAIHRFGKSYSSLYFALVNHFERQGGFGMALQMVKSTRNIEDVFACVGMVAAPNMVYHRMYVKNVIAEFVESVMEYISKIPADQVKYIKKRNLVEFLARLEELMRRVYTSKTKGELFIKLRIEISISLLGAEQLEKRIQAIKVIAETCKSAKASQEAYRHTKSPKANDAFVLSNLLKVPQLISEIFGKRSHIELIQRSTEILKFLLLFSSITKKDFNVIWECCVNDEQSKVEILKVISDSSNLLPGELIGFIVEKYIVIPNSEFKDQDIGILCELSRNYTQLNLQTLEQILDMLWDLLRGGLKGFPEETYERVMHRFCDVITTPARVPEELMKKYFNQCYEMLEVGDDSMLAMVIIRRSMMQLPCTRKNVSVQEFTSGLLAEGNAVANFFGDFQRFCSARNVDVAAHERGLKERKLFLVFILNRAGYRMSRENIDFLWESLVKCAITPEDQKVFYEIFKELFTTGMEEHVASMEDIKDFFTNTLCSDDNNFQALPIEGMQVIESLLITVNRDMNTIVEIGAVRKKEQSYGRYNGMIGPMPPSEAVQEEEIEFLVKVLPSEVVGASMLWKIVLEALSEQVTIRAIELISKIYTKLSEELENKIAEISSSFIETAVKQLKLCHQNMLKGNLSRSNEIVKMLRLIEQMLDESEKKGNGGITPLTALLKGREVKFSVKNYAVDTLDRPDVPDAVEVSVHSNTTYWQLVILVARKLLIEPELIRIKFPNIEITNKDNAKTLEELGVVGGECATARKISWNQMPRLSLTKNGSLTTKARAVLVEVFGRYSKEGEMHPENYAKFTQACLSDKNITAHNSQIREIFQEYDRESKGYLILEEFLQFYENASLHTEEVVWHNFRELGYGPDLEKLDAGKEQSVTAVVRERLPRYLLANNSEYLSFIFSLVSTLPPHLDLQGEVGSTAWNLIFKLAVSNSHLEKIKTMFAKEADYWEEFFESADFCRTTYTLYLLQCMVCDSSDKELAEIRQEPSLEEREALRIDLLKSKAVLHAVKYVKNLEGQKLQESSVTYVRMTLKIVMAFLVESLKGNKQLPPEFYLYEYRVMKDDRIMGQRQTEAEVTGTLDERYLWCYTELCSTLTGDLGLSLLSSLDALQLAKSLIITLNNLLEFSDLTGNVISLIDEISFLLKMLFAYRNDLHELVDRTHNVPNVLLKGILFARAQYVEDIIQQLTYFLATNISSGPAAKSPLVQILAAFLDSRILFNKFAKMSLYELLTILLGQYKRLKSDEYIDTSAKFTEIMEYFTSCSSLEYSQLGAPLLGLLELASELMLVTNYSDLPDTSRLLKFISQIFFGGLFPDSKGKFLCRAADTRKTAYNLINRIGQHSTVCLAFLLRDCLLELREKVSELGLWGYVPGHHERSPLGFTGLKNIGCICYSNSMLQQFFLIAPFRNAIVSMRDGKEPNYAENGVDDNLIHQFQRTFVYLMNSSRKDFNPAAFCYSFKEFDGKPTNTAIQHDAHEFLNILFERLEKEFKGTAYERLVQSVFGGKQCSQVICTNCGFVSSTYEDYYTLSLEIKNQRTLDDSLERFIAESTVSDYRCSCCQQRVDVSKRTLISTLPNVLIVHLQRFTYNFDTFMNEKIHTRLEFPNILTMTNYTEEGHVKSDENKKNIKNVKERVAQAENEKEMDEKKAKDKYQEPLPEKILKEDEYYRYKLVGVLMHSGNAEAGHYYSYIDIDRGGASENPNPENDHWLEFNDSCISEFAFSRIPGKCFGGSLEEMDTGYMEENSEVARLIGGRSKSAYMLFYERQKKDAIPLKCVFSSSLECDGTALSRTGNHSPPRDSPADTFGYYDFYGVPCTVASELLQEVEGDNERFLYEQLVYDSDFVRFCRELFNYAKISYSCAHQADEKNLLRQLLCTFIEKYFFDIASHVALGSAFTIGHISEDMMKIFAASPREGEVLLRKYMCRPEQLFELMLKCPEESVRACVHKALVGAFTSVSKHAGEESQEVLRGFFDVMMGLIGYELSVQWTKFKQFFELLRDIVVTADEDLLEYFVKRDVVACLLDFFLEKSSPLIALNTKRYEMGNYTQSPEFSPLIETVVFVVSRARLPNQPDLKSEGPVLELSEPALKCLQCEDLIPRYIKHSVKSASLSHIISRLSLDNRKFTKQTCKALINGLEGYEIAKLSQYITLMCEQLALKDQYQKLRFALLLGYPQPISKIAFGLADNNDISDDVNSYVSPLEGKKSLLQGLWDERKRCEKAVAQTLKVLLGLCLEDAQLYVYLKKMPPPTYLLSRYMDWVPLFLEAYFKETGYMSAAEIKEKNQLIEDVKELYAKFQEKVTKDGIDESELYMVGKVLGERELPEKEILAGNVQLKVTELTVEVYPSKPMDGYNAALSGDYLIKHFGHIHINANSRHESRGAAEAKKVTLNLQQVNGQDNNELLYSVINGPEKGEGERERVGAAGAEIELKPLGMSKELGRARDEEQLPVGKPVKRPHIYDQPENAEEEENAGFAAPTIPAREEPVAEGAVETQFEADKEESKLPGENPSVAEPEEEEALYRPLAIFHRITLLAMGEANATVKVLVKPSEGEAANFYYPTVGLRYKIKKSLRPILMLQKISTEKEMGPYEITIKIKEEAAPQPAFKPPPATDYQREDDAYVCPAYDEGTVSCSLCTFSNSAACKSCVICGNPLVGTLPQRE